MIKLKSPREIGLMREAGRLVARALDTVGKMAVPGVSTSEMDEAVAWGLRGAAPPPLLRGFPN